MTTFIYKAKRNSSETVTGRISAHSQEEAIDLINQLGLLPVTVDEMQETQTSFGSSSRKISYKDLYIFSRQLSNLLRSGVSLVQSLAIIEHEIQNADFRKLLQAVVWEIKNGRSFSEALSLHPKVFSPLFVTMTRAGEETGDLQEILIDMADYQKRQAEIIAMVKTALIYPVIMGMVGIATVVFILTFVLPRMSDLFSSIGSELPLMTRMLLAASSALTDYGVYVLVGILCIIFALVRWFRSVMGRLFLSRTVLKLPYFGNMILKSQLARFCRTLELLLNRGVTIISALQTSIPILSNELIKYHLQQGTIKLTGGASLGASLKEVPQIPTIMSHLIAVGEESGNLEDVLGELAQTYEMETRESIKTMTTLLEPLMILLIGLVVGFMVFAMLLPIFQIDIMAQ